MAGTVTPSARRPALCPASSSDPLLNVRVTTGCKVLPADTVFGERDYLIVRAKNVGMAPVVLSGAEVWLPRGSTKKYLPVTRTFFTGGALLTHQSRSFLIAQDEVLACLRSPLRAPVACVVDEAGRRYWSCGQIVRWMRWLRG